MTKILELERLCLEYGESIKRLSSSNSQEAMKELRLMTLKRLNVKDQLLDEYRKLYQRKV